MSNQTGPRAKRRAGPRAKRRAKRHLRRVALQAAGRLVKASSCCDAIVVNASRNVGPRVTVTDTATGQALGAVIDPMKTFFLAKGIRTHCRMRPRLFVCGRCVQTRRLLRIDWRTAFSECVEEGRGGTALPQCETLRPRLRAKIASMCDVCPTLN